jgi:copper(I)-binding protein
MTGTKTRAGGGVLAGIALVAAASAALADPHQVKHGDITVSERLVRASIGASPNSAAYMVIANSGATPDALVAARCACAASATVHQTETMAGMSMMESTGPVVIPAHGQVVFKPGGLHVMLTHLKEPLVEGGQQDITLVFQHAGAVRMSFHIRSVIAVGGPPPMRGMGR